MGEGEGVNWRWFSRSCGLWLFFLGTTWNAQYNVKGVDEYAAWIVVSMFFAGTGIALIAAPDWYWR